MANGLAVCTRIKIHKTLPSNWQILHRDSRIPWQVYIAHENDNVHVGW